MTLKLENRLTRNEPAIQEAHLWDKFREGCEKSLIKIYDLNLQLLYKYGLKLTKDEPFVKDCIQELFIDLWRRHKSLGPTTSIKFYLLRSLRRKIYKSLSPNSQSTSLGSYRCEELFDQSFEASLIESQVAEERKSMLLKKVDLLPKRQKEAIFLKYFEELSYEEIASIMSLSKPSLYILINRSIESLKKLFLF